MSAKLSEAEKKAILDSARWVESASGGENLFLTIPSSVYFEGFTNSLPDPLTLTMRFRAKPLVQDPQGDYL